MEDHFHIKEFCNCYCFYIGPLFTDLPDKFLEFIVCLEIYLFEELVKAKISIFCSFRLVLFKLHKKKRQR